MSDDGSSKKLITSDELHEHLQELGKIVRGDQTTRGSKTPAQLGKYRIDGTLGMGGESVALRAWDTDLRREVVLKIHNQATTEESRERILREGRALARIASPYVARCHTVETFADTPCLVLEYVDGIRLTDKIRQFGMQESEAAKVIACLADGLDSIHKANVIHRDMKPSNVVLSHEGIPKIIDFGLSSGNGLSSSEGFGTAVYLPPERASGLSDGDVRGDVFGLGAILYEMLTGSAPFEANSKSEAIDNAANARVVRPLPNPSHAISKLCMKCLAPNPSDRFASANEVAVAARKASQTRSRLLPYLATTLLATGLIAAIAFVLFSVNTKSPSENSEGRFTPIANVADEDVIWVDGSITQSGDGTRQAPFKTIAAGVNYAHPGCVVRVRGHADGDQITYNETHIILDTNQHRDLILTNWGHENQGGDNLLPRIVHRDDESVETGFHAINVFASGVRISHFQIDNAINGAIAITPQEHYLPFPERIEIRDCSFNTCRTGITVSKANHVDIHSVSFTDCGHDQGEASISVTTVDDLRIFRASIGRHNDLAGGLGIFVEDATGVEIAQSQISGSQQPAIICLSIDESLIANNMIVNSNCGIKFTGNGSISNTLVVGNIIARPKHFGIGVLGTPPESPGPGTVELVIAQNTIVSSLDGVGIEFAAASAKRCEVTRNISLRNRWGDLEVGEKLHLPVTANVVRKEMVTGGAWLLNGKNIWVPKQGDKYKSVLMGSESNCTDLAGLLDLRNYDLVPGCVAMNVVNSSKRKVIFPADIRGNKRDSVAPNVGALETVLPGTDEAKYGTKALKTANP